MKITENIVSAVTEVYQKKRMPVVGIDGLGGAGKSTVAEKVCEELTEKGIHTILLHADDFIHPRAVRYDDSYPEWECYYKVQWRYDYFIDLINTAKRSPDNISAELYDKENDSYNTVTYPIRRNTVIIVEGIFLQRNELDGVFDYMV